MKKILGVLLITTLILASFVACGSDDSKESGKTGDSTAVAQSQVGSEKADSSKHNKEDAKNQRENTKSEKNKEKKDADSSQSARAGQNNGDNGNSSQKDNNQKNKNQKKSAKYCTITVTCHTLISKKGELDSSVASQVPPKGIILAKREVKICAGDTVFDITKRSLKGAGIALSHQGSSSTAYVDGINNIFEKDAGSKSGWLYKVNGKKMGIGCGACNVKSGDAIQWAFTCNMGSDI